MPSPVDHQPKIPQPPTLSKALIDWLNSVYPNVQPSLKESEREVWVRVGQRQVIDLLATVLARQEKKPFNHV